MAIRNTKRYFSVKNAVKYKLVPWSYRTALLRASDGTLKAAQLGKDKVYYTCVEWINESFENGISERYSQRKKREGK